MKNWYRRIPVLALPIVAANLGVPLLSLVDTGIAGHLGTAAALGGVALGGLIFNLLAWNLAFLRMTTTGLVAQARGAGDAGAMRLASLRSLLLAVLLGLLGLALRRPLTMLGLALLGGSAAVREMAVAYLTARFWAMPASLANMAILGDLLGRQRTGLGLFIQLFVNAANIGLVWLLVAGFGLGVGGIGAATAMADGLGLGLGLLVLRRLRAKGLSPLAWRVLLEPSALQRFFLLNRDIFIRTLCLSGVTSAFSAMGAGLGDAVLAANAVLLNFHTFASYGLDGFAYVAETLVGAAVGARDRETLRASSRAGFVWAFATALGFSVVYLIFGPAIIDLLTDRPEVRALARAALPWTAAMPTVAVWSFQLDGIFIGATLSRELRNAMLLSFVIFLLAAVPLKLVFANEGLWTAMLLFMAVRGVTLARRYPAIGRDWPVTAAP